MALTDRVIARIGNQRLIELTNEGTTAATVDAAVLAAAAADAAAEFEAASGVVYDDTAAIHHAAAVRGVVYYLHVYKGNASAGMTDAKAAWREALRDFARALGRGRILPVTNSNLTASREDISSGDPVRPTFDRENLTGIQLQPPSVE